MLRPSAECAGQAWEGGGGAVDVTHQEREAPFLLPTPSRHTALPSLGSPLSLRLAPLSLITHLTQSRSNTSQMPRPNAHKTTNGINHRLSWNPIARNALAYATPAPRSAR